MSSVALNFASCFLVRLLHEKQAGEQEQSPCECVDAEGGLINGKNPLDSH